MRDIRWDLRERLETTVKQRNELSGRVRALEAQEQRLRALLNDEEFSHFQQLPVASSTSSEATGGARLREFVLGSLQDGHDWEPPALEGARPRHRLTTIGASGRSLNITLVNLLREGLVTRAKDGRWRLRDPAAQLPLDLASPSNGENDNEQLTL